MITGWKLNMGIAAIAFIAAWQVQAWRHTAEVEKMRSAHSQALQRAEKAARKAEHRLRDKVAEIDRLTEQSRREVNIVTEIVEKEVIRYVETDPAAGSCQLSPGWVHTHNAATTARLPENPTAPSPPDDAPRAIEPVTDIDVLRTVTRNYRGCVAEMEKLKGLQRYVEGVLAGVE